MTLVVKLRYTNKDWWIDWQRAGPFLCKCGDDCASLETNGTRNSSFLFPCCDLSRLLWLAHMALFVHGSTCDHCAPSLVNKSQWQSTHRHKAQIVSLSIFIFLRVVTVDTPTPALVFDRFVTHVHQPYLNQRQTIDCLHTQMIFFFLMSHASKPSLAKYRSTYLQIKINTIHLHHWACQ